jgi:hypothetical protein
MNMRQFWQKLPNNDRIGFTLKIESFQLRKRHGRMTLSSGESWRRKKKQRKMAEKEYGGCKAFFFLSDRNYNKAESMICPW